MPVGPVGSNEVIPPRAEEDESFESYDETPVNADVDWVPARHRAGRQSTEERT